MNTNPFSEVIDAFDKNDAGPIVSYIEHVQQEIEDDYVLYIIEACIHKLFDLKDLTAFVEPVLGALADQNINVDASYFIDCFHIIESGEFVQKMRKARRSNPLQILPCKHENQEQLFAIIHYLIKLGMDVNPAVEQHPSPSLHQCLMSYWDIGIIQAFVANGLDPLWIDRNDRTTVMFAASNMFHSVEIMRWLNEEHNVPYNTKDRQDRTAIHYAGSVNALMHLNVYLSATQRDRYGFTVMHHICQSALMIDDFIEMVTVLVSNRLNINDNNNVKKQTPMMVYFMARDVWRFKNDHIQGLLAMIRLFADVEAKDANGNNVLKYADHAETRRLSIVQGIPGLPLPDDAFAFSQVLKQHTPRIQGSMVIQALRKNSQIACMLSTHVNHLPFDLILKISRMALPRIMSLDIPMVKRAISFFIKSSNEKYIQANRAGMK